MKPYFKIVSALGLLLVAGFTGPSLAAADYDPPRCPEQGFPHKKIIGAHYDRASAQRGFQVYKEVCASCHGLRLVAFRTLSGIGFNEDQIKAIAADYTMTAEPNEEGEVLDRPGQPFDYFPDPYPNPQAAAFANNGAYPPDLSLMVKARKDGACKMYSLLTGYRDPTAAELEHMPDGKVPDTAYFNPYKAGKVIAMAPPLFEGMVEYTGDNPPEATVSQMAYDVTTFLAWTAEPKLEERKRIGFLFMSLLIIACGLFFFSYRRIAKRVIGH